VWHYICCNRKSLFVTKSKRSKAIACLVLCRPTTWAFFALCIDWLFAGLAEAQLSKALAGVIWGVRQVGAWPAGACWALARWVGAAWTNSRARTGFWEHCRWLAKPNGSKAIACSVFLWPAIWALFARGVDRLFALVAEAQFSKALAGMVACSVNPLPWPARVALARRVFAFRAQR